ncbi:MAG: divalent cation transporter [Cobetia sp.]|jgi:ZIP family zinc transporter|uniref:ZIP family metal transporter n=3 Tax=Halomonadaceae TaxID=28256 RepID=UPI000C663D42|nr:divalent cation transporter [Cobetia amphilecti]MBF07386.1 divalent cation transporter [Cobetia sp.]NUJ54764.1 divalent cation transporter [Cobetia marina]MBK08189.1 divalent cation transporter [Cobetia sp.]WOI27025.1 divalent cation transporter [Cobetia amphilecti]HAR07326.1 divalent cation transporter [Cobetia sp.]
MMASIPWTMVALAWAAGLCMPLGGVIAQLERSHESHVKRSWLAGITALGGGILLAAVSLVLVPHAMQALSIATLLGLFLLGALIFMQLDRWLARGGGAKGQLLAMLMDFIPEAIALGALASASPAAAMLLALFIAVQNLPEGFNAYRELEGAGLTARQGLGAFVLLSLLGPLAALAGHLWLADAPGVLGGLMAFAAGGILYLVFQDIAPQSRVAHHWSPPLGASLGFMIGMLGDRLVG